MAIEIVDFPIKNGGSFHRYVSLPEGNQYHNGPFIDGLPIKHGDLKNGYVKITRW